jgi:hypothetical protein
MFGRCVSIDVSVGRYVDHLRLDVGGKDMTLWNAMGDAPHVCKTSAGGYNLSDR